MNQPVIKGKEPFHIFGITIKTTNANEMTANAKIPQLWNTYYEQKVYEKIPASDQGGVTYGLYSDYEQGVDGEYSMTVGLEGGPRDTLPEGIVVKTVPAAKYVVFTSDIGPVSEIVIKAWQEIWDWFELADVERTYTGDFEVYDERCENPHQAQVDIYVAIKE
ncbi:AraC family transcriptional regulator [Bacillus sp. FJAT-49705]|uniref:AraC family transcriptional regulator n=1 Tax=Cytobacillus citreus TaxID=2833586 RepID=A0ABS5NZD2_9BACI|nr:GyrI-like domain-containing protein [Cytobacillus citreus]MBS4192728.1 AraC family transcriptional regulator [Cytobacillus citreus]